MQQVVATKVVGDKGEQAVATFLEKQTFIIKEMNYKKQYGEIDLIAQKKDLIVFVEVKTRKKHYFDASLLITLSKQKKIIMVAKEYIAANTLHHFTFRFDVALVTAGADTHDIVYIPNAFLGE